jgi:hypothetical protein
MYPKIAALSLASLLVISGLMCQPAPKPIAPVEITPLSVEAFAEYQALLKSVNGLKADLEQAREVNAIREASLAKLREENAKISQHCRELMSALEKTRSAAQPKAAPVCTTGTCAPRVQYYYVPRQTAWYPGKRLFGGR